MACSRLQNINQHLGSPISAVRTEPVAGSDGIPTITNIRAIKTVLFHTFARTDWLRVCWALPAAWLRRAACALPTMHNKYCTLLIALTSVA